jgi:hypothetical protein
MPYKVQPSNRVDFITEEGDELTQLPYPFFIDAEGRVLNHEMMKASVALGFQKRLDVHRIDLRWKDAIVDPSKVVNMYLVTVWDGKFQTTPLAIMSLEEV